MLRLVCLRHARVVEHPRLQEAERELVYLQTSPQLFMSTRARVLSAKRDRERQRQRILLSRSMHPKDNPPIDEGNNRPSTSLSRAGSTLSRRSSLAGSSTYSASVSSNRSSRLSHSRSEASSRLTERALDCIERLEISLADEKHQREVLQNEIKWLKTHVNDFYF